MKRNYVLLLSLMLTIITVFTSCKKNNIEYKNDYERSHDSWMSFKKSSNNSYSYKVSSGSWTGTSSETLITVKDGKVTDRSYVYKIPGKIPGESTIKDEWHEDQTTLNTHTAGASALTLDDVYQKAKTEWLLKRKDAQTFFEAGNSGMISSCGYTMDGCQDDCFNGIKITSILKL